MIIFFALVLIPLCLFECEFAGCLGPMQHFREENQVSMFATQNCEIDLLSAADFVK